MNVRLNIVNLEDGMPSVPQARARLSSEIRSARKQGATLLKCIHGYGSSGTGGALRIALQATLRQMTERGEIGGCIFGENWGPGDDTSWILAKRHPELKRDHDFGRKNRGITIVIL